LLKDDSMSTIAISIVGKEIIYTASNPIKKNEVNKEKSDGVGLENLKKRLEILFPSKHKFNITVEENIYHIYISFWNE
jgi:two-component system, LytTR family, sensor kinase